MPKKFIKISPIITLGAVLATGNLVAPNANAELYDPYDGRQLWSVQELIDLNHEADAELQDRCGDKTGWQWSDCMWNLREEWDERSGAYGALGAFREPSFIITAINPNDETIRAVFHDTDMMEYEMSGEEKHFPVIKAYLAWLDQTYDTSKYYLDYFRNHESATGMHVIFDSNNIEEESGWWPADEEFTIEAVDHDISQNDLENNSEILFFVDNHPVSVSGHTSYVRQCYGSPNYVEGMECRIMYDEYGNYYYLPYSVEVSAPEPKDDSNPTPSPIEADAPEPKDDSGSTTDAEDKAITKNDSGKSTAKSTSGSYVAYSSASAGSNTSDSYTDSDQVVSLANYSGSDDSVDSADPQSDAQSDSTESESPSSESTETTNNDAEGSFTAPLGGGEEANSCAADFPWWFVALILACDAVIMWIFWPKKREN